MLKAGPRWRLWPIGQEMVRDTLRRWVLDRIGDHSAHCSVDTGLNLLFGVQKLDADMECAPRAGRDYAAVLTVCRA